MELGSQPVSTTRDSQLRGLRRLTSHRRHRHRRSAARIFLHCGCTACCTARCSGSIACTPLSGSHSVKAHLTLTYVHHRLTLLRALLRLVLAVLAMCSDRLRYLILALDGDGNNSPTLALCQRLQAAGHEVVFAGYETQRGMAEASGLQFRPLLLSSIRLKQLSEHAVTAQVLSMIANPEHLTEIPQMVAAVTPDRIVIDCMMTAGLIALMQQQRQQAAAASGGLPPVSILFHSTVSGMSCLGGIPYSVVNQMRQQAGLAPLLTFRQGDVTADINRMRAEARLLPVQGLWQLWLDFLSSLPRSQALVASVLQLETDEFAQRIALQPPGRFRYVGALLPEPSRPIHVEASLTALCSSSTSTRIASLPFALSRSEPPSADPLILVSFHSGRALLQVSRIARVLQALGSGSQRSCRVVVTYGEQPVGSLQVPANAAVVPYIPHCLVLPTASVCITHAGHGTITAALCHGVPVLCLPNLGDQTFAVSARARARCGHRAQRRDGNSGYHQDGRPPAAGRAVLQSQGAAAERGGL